MQFVPGPGLLGRRVFVYTNYVVGDGGEWRPPAPGPPAPRPDPRPVAADEAAEAEFVRGRYWPLEWRRGGEGFAGADEGAPLPPGALLHDTDLHCELRLARAGAFHYYFVYDAA